MWRPARVSRSVRAICLEQRRIVQRLRGFTRGIALALCSANEHAVARWEASMSSAFAGPSWGAPKPSVGARCQFCRQPAGAEQKFCGACGAVISVKCERKQATVLVMDVCGFTAMSERLDPEDVRAIMERAFEVMLDAVHAYGGSVNQFLGDGIM